MRVLGNALLVRNKINPFLDIGVLHGEQVKIEGLSFGRGRTVTESEVVDGLS